MDLFKAFNQWAERPADERFWDLPEMALACRAYRDTAVTSTIRYRDLRVEADGKEIQLIGKTGTPASLTHYAFGQLAQRAKAPAAYLRTLPATLAAQNMNHGLKARDETDTARLLFHCNGGMLLRAALSEQYTRIWNHEVADRIMELEQEGWRVPPARPAPKGDPRARPATEADILDDRHGMLSVSVGDMIAPAGIYASDRDMFVFLVNESKTIDDGSDGGLARFMMLWNSEVGDKSFGGMGGYYKHVCGNHIVWDASDVMEFRIRHVGQARHRAWSQLKMDVRRYSNSSVSDAEARIVSARTYELGRDKDQVVDKVLGFARKKKLYAINGDRLGAAFEAAERHRDWYGCAPNTVYGMVNGLTEVSQQTPHAETRAKLDRAAGRIMEIAF